MKCPICGCEAELLFLVHCSNPNCQNYSCSITIVNSIIKSEYPTITKGDFVRFYMLSLDEMERDEDEVVRDNPNFYSNTMSSCGVGSGMIEWIDGKFYEVGDIHDDGHSFYLFDDDSWVWSVIWVEDIKKS